MTVTLNRVLLGLAAIGQFHYSYEQQKDIFKLEGVRNSHPHTPAERKLEMEAKDLATKLGITRRIRVVREENLGSLAAVNDAFFSKNPFLIYNKEILTQKKEVREFALSHELAHLSGCHVFLASTPIFAAGFAATRFALNRLPLTPYLLRKTMPFTMGIGSSWQADRWKEKQADLKGYSICSKEGKRHATDVFEQMISTHLTALNRDPNFKYLLTQKGDSRLDFQHPPLSRRVAYLRQLQAKDNLHQKVLK